MLDYILEELDSAIVLVEWGELLAAEFPEARLDVKLSFAENGRSSDANYRSIELVGTGSRWKSVLVAMETQK